MESKVNPETEESEFEKSELVKPQPIENRLVDEAEALVNHLTVVILQENIGRHFQ